MTAPGEVGRNPATNGAQPWDRRLRAQLVAAARRRLARADRHRDAAVGIEPERSEAVRDRRGL